MASFPESTNKDCKQCDYCLLRDISSDYEEYEYYCTLTNIVISYVLTKNKPCGLKGGKIYKANYEIKNIGND